MVRPHHPQTVDTAHVVPLAFIATTPAKYCYRAVATFIKHVTNMPPTASLHRHKEPQALRVSGIAPEETVLSPITRSPRDRPAAPSQANRSSRVSSSFRRGTSLFSKSSKSHSDHGNTEGEGAIEDILAGDPIVYHGGWVSARGNVVALNLISPGKVPRS